ncbi:formyl transferase [Streptomyces canus]|uniref:formyl transferase n=1 Tax=Streptomyces canus TaxID=58343 RepID=UPI0033D6AD5E
MADDTTHLSLARGEGALRVVLLCGDGPQHRYLAHLLHQNFTLTGLVVEPSAQQRRRLWEVGHRRTWRHRVIHEWRQRLLGYRAYRRNFFAGVGAGFGWPDCTSAHPPWINDDSVVEALTRWRPDVTVVCGTSLIRPEVLDRAGLAINVHAGLLPYYRGNQCFFMALYRGDYGRIGASLHVATAELDGGPLLAVVRPPMAPTDHEESLYSRTMRQTMLVLVDLVHRMAAGESIPAARQSAIGRTYRNSDRRLRHDLHWGLFRLTGRRRCPVATDWSISYQ